MSKGVFPPKECLWLSPKYHGRPMSDYSVLDLCHAVRLLQFFDVMIWWCNHIIKWSYICSQNGSETLILTPKCWFSMGKYYFLILYHFWRKYETILWCDYIIISSHQKTAIAVQCDKGPVPYSVTPWYLGIIVNILWVENTFAKLDEFYLSFIFEKFKTVIFQ